MIPRFPKVPLIVFVALASAVVAWWWIPKKVTLDHRLTAVAVSPSGRWLAMANVGGWVTIWQNWESPNAYRIRVGKTAAQDLLFVPGGEEAQAPAGLAVANESLHYEPLVLGGSVAALAATREAYSHLRVSLDGSRLLVVTGSGAVEIRDSETGQELAGVCCATDAVFLDDERIVTAGTWPGVWSVRDGASVTRLANDRELEALSSVAVSSNESNSDRGLILMGGDGVLYQWDAESLERGDDVAVSLRIDSMQPVAGTAWVALAEIAAEVVEETTGDEGDAEQAKLPGRVELWNSVTGELRSLVNAHPTTPLISGPEPGLLRFGTEAGSMETWDAGSGEMVRMQSMR